MSFSACRSGLLAPALSCWPALVLADDSVPTLPDDQDYLCETIARSPGASVPPGDRAWFDRTCTCMEKRIWGRAGSRRFAARVKAGMGEAQTSALEEGCNLVGLTTWDDCLARE